MRDNSVSVAAIAEMSLGSVFSAKNTAAMSPQPVNVRRLSDKRSRTYQKKTGDTRMDRIVQQKATEKRYRRALRNIGLDASVSSSPLTEGSH